MMAVSVGSSAEALNGSSGGERPQDESHHDEGSARARQRQPRTLECESTSAGDVILVEPSSFDERSDGSKTPPPGQASESRQQRSPPEAIAKEEDHEETRANPSSPKPGRRHRHRRELSAHFFDAASISDTRPGSPRGSDNDEAVVKKEHDHQRHPAGILMDEDNLSGRKHRRIFSGGHSNPNLAHRRINSRGAARAVRRATRHHREDSQGLDLLSAAVAASKDELAAAAGDGGTTYWEPPASAGQARPSLGYVSTVSYDHPSSSSAMSSSTTSPPGNEQHEMHPPPPQHRRTNSRSGGYHGPPPPYITSSQPPHHYHHPGHHPYPSHHHPGHHPYQHHHHPYYASYHRPPHGAPPYHMHYSHTDYYHHGHPPHSHQHNPHHPKTMYPSSVAHSEHLPPPPPGSDPDSDEEKQSSAEDAKDRASTTQGSQTFVTAISVGNGRKTMTASAAGAHEPKGKSPDGKIKTASGVPSHVEGVGHHRKMSSIGSIGTILGNSFFPSEDKPGHHRKMSSMVSFLQGMDEEKAGHHRKMSSTVSFLQGLDDDAVGVLTAENANADDPFLRNLHASHASREIARSPQHRYTGPSPPRARTASPPPIPKEEEDETPKLLPRSEPSAPVQEPPRHPGPMAAAVMPPPHAPMPPAPPHVVCHPVGTGHPPVAGMDEPVESKLAAGGTSKRVRRKCTIEGCANRVVQGGLCISHGAKRKTCKHPGCSKNVKKAGLCSTHGPARKRCEADGCEKVAVQGGRCIAHGAKKKLCSMEGCTKQAILSGMCKKHHDQEKEREAKRKPKRHQPTHTRGLSIFQEMSADTVQSLLNDQTPLEGGAAKPPTPRRRSGW